MEKTVPDLNINKEKKKEYKEELGTHRLVDCVWSLSAWVCARGQPKTDPRPVIINKLWDPG